MLGYRHTMIWLREYPWVLTISLMFLDHMRLHTYTVECAERAAVETTGRRARRHAGRCCTPNDSLLRLDERGNKPPSERREAERYLFGVIMVVQANRANKSWNKQKKTSHRQAARHRCTPKTGEQARQEHAGDAMWVDHDVQRAVKIARVVEHDNTMQENTDFPSTYRTAETFVARNGERRDPQEWETEQKAVQNKFKLTTAAGTAAA